MNKLYIISALLLVTWAIVYFGYNSSSYVHLILIIGLLLVAVKYFFDNAQQA